MCLHEVLVAVAVRLVVAGVVVRVEHLGVVDLEGVGGGGAAGPGDCAPGTLVGT